MRTYKQIEAKTRLLKSPQMVRAEISGPFGVHRTIDGIGEFKGTWTATHVRTGYALAVGFPTKAATMKTVKAVLAAFPDKWDADTTAAIYMGFSREEKRRIKDILGEGMKP